MNRFNFRKLSIDGVFEITNIPISDERGFLSRLSCANELQNLGWKNNVIQINRTLTRQIGTIRGMHYQKPPASETKIIICLKGEIFDVAIDIRKESKTFLKYISLKISEEQNNMLLIPKGFAHGFQTLTNNVELLYLHDYKYSPEYDSGLNPLDPSININWPITENKISKKDSNSRLINEYNFIGI